MRAARGGGAAALATVIAGCRGEAGAAREAVEAAAGAAPALWFGGDVHLGAAPRGGLAEVVVAMGGAAGVVNLEGPIAAGAGDARVEGGRVWLANPAEAPGFLRAEGVWAASIVNNHAGDDGPAGAERTARALLAAGVVPVGRAPARVDVGGVPVRLFAYDLDADAVVEAVGRDLAGVDEVAAVAFHVTGPASYLPRPELTAAVDAAVASGADIVVAHGTHVVGPVERRGDTVIAWGLGNLLFDCVCTDEGEGVVLRVELSAGRPAEIVPVAAGLGGAPATLAVEPEGVLDLVAGLGGTPMTRVGGRGRF